MKKQIKDLGEKATIGVLVISSLATAIATAKPPIKQAESTQAECWIDIDTGETVIDTLSNRDVEIKI